MEGPSARPESAPGERTAHSDIPRTSVPSLVVVLMGLLMCAMAFACATAMHTVGCRTLPSVEECRIEVLRITNACLRTCVTAQCSGATVLCGDSITSRWCGKPRASGDVGGYAEPDDTTSCQIPIDELHWCELPVPASCRSQMMVHELAHTCGWKHGAGMGVPGNNGRFAWRDECE